MKIIDCYIENFGKLSDFNYKFSDGMNCIKEDNGYGKTTLSVFIKAMLYGLDDTKSTKLEKNDRKHYLPWNNNRCAGSLTFESGGRRYRIERVFMPKASEDTFKLYDCASGKESNDFTEKIGEELFGIDADGFERTVFLSEANLSGKNDNKTVSAKLSNLVGYDGDLSAMDTAIELLEKQRKIYHRKGGAGEIGEIKRKRSEIEREICDLYRIKEDYTAEETKLAAIIKELNGLYQEKETLEKERRRADEIKLKRGYEKQYHDMETAVRSEEESKAALDNFFKNGLPSPDEIDIAKSLLEEANRLEKTASLNTSYEFNTLSSFFPAGIDDEKFDEMSSLLVSLQDARKESALLEGEITLAKDEAKNAHAPALSEVDSKINALLRTKEIKKIWPVTLALGILFLVTGIYLGVAFSSLLYLISLPSLLFGALSVANIAKLKGDTSRDAKKEAELFAHKFTNGKSVSEKELLSALYEIKNHSLNAEKIYDKICTLETRIGAVNDKINAIEKRACDFITLFPISKALSVDEALSEIFKKRALYIALLEAEDTSSKKHQNNLLLAKEKREKAEAFLSKFPTLTSRPFDEISSKLIEYVSLSRSIERMRLNLAEFAEKHGILCSDAGSADAEVIISVDPALLNEKISELEKAKVLSERQCRILSEKIERIDELTAQKEELSERSAEYEKKLNTILKTKDYLAEAKDKLTSKYLSKTKTAFDRYVSIIASESNESFSMDTSFSVMKNERGTLRPTEAYSLGMREFYALAARLALVESLYENEKPFIVLDDPFAHLDDSKLAQAKSALQSIAKNKQVIYFTCTDARKI